ncbi:hypothetical protein SLA2020_064660 [Shorea laevis]
MGSVTFAMIALTILFLVSKLLHVLWIVLWRPYSLTKRLKKQGVNGPPGRIISGSLDEINEMKMEAREMILDTDSNDIVQRILPHYHRWSSKYGNDLVLLEGQNWVRRRRIINPALFPDKLKFMVKRMAACAISMLQEWKDQAAMANDKCKKIEMLAEFQRLTADIIAHTAFGSNYVHGKEVFQAQRQLQRLVTTANSSILIPGNQYLPTPSNLRIWKLDRKMKKTLRQIIESRLQKSRTTTSSSPACCFGDDQLGLMIATSKTNQLKANLKLNMNEIIKECKTFFFVGHETTSSLLTWKMFLLSKHQEWQAKLTKEVLKECGKGISNTDMLAKLKLVNMVLLEVLRLYGPVVALVREASKKHNIGEFNDSKENCWFSFSLSLDYQHAPANNITLQHQHGLPIVIKPLNMKDK